MIRSAPLSALAFAAFLVVSGACGGDDDDTGASPPPDVSSQGTEDPAAEPSGDAEPAKGPETRIEAGDLFLAPEELTLPAGPHAFRYVNKGSLPHTLLIDGGPELKLKVNKKGAEDIASVTLEPGDYTLYCDVPGHRDGGMESKLTVE